MATSALEYTYWLMEEAVRRLNLGYHSDWFLDELRGFDDRFSSDISVKLADRNHPGKRRPYYFKIVRIKHKSPHKSYIFGGGERFHPSVSISKFENLAIEMSIKFWIMGLPYAGAKGGMLIDPQLYSKDELKDIVNKMVEKLVEYGVIGPFKDRLAPDVGTTAEIMDWITEHYGYMLELAGRKDPFYEGIATGKPGTNGIPFRKAATGVGLHYALQTFRKKLGLGTNQPIIAALNGFGNVGSNFAEYAGKSNAKIAAVGDLCNKTFGGIYKPDGIPIKELAVYVAAHPQKSVQGFEDECGGMKISNRMDFFSLPVDIFVPAALENDITEKEAVAMKCRVVLEGANSPTTKEGDEILAERGIHVIPDVYANGGGGICSYWEHAYNIGGVDRHPEAPVPTSRENDRVMHTAMQRYMRIHGAEILKIAETYKVPYRLAGYMLALGRVFPMFCAKRRMNGSS